MLKYLIFDLDETLYPRNAGVMPAIARRIGQYMTERMGFTPEESDRLRHRFFAHYGTTLRGLQAEFEVDVDDYLQYVHHIPLEDYLAPNPALDAMLARMAWPKVIFTNADDAHAQRVLARLGIARHFAHIFDIRALEFYNKPDPQAYARMLQALRVTGPECMLIEDMARNLRPAKEQFGMVTVLVDGPATPGIDFCIANVLDLESITTTR